MLESWKARPKKGGMLESWNVGKLESWNVAKLGAKQLESWKVRPNQVGKLESEAKNIGQKLESQHIRLSIGTSTHTGTHDEYLNCSGIMLFYILSLMGVLI